MATALEIINKSIKVLKPPPDMTLSQWADDRRYVSPAVSSYPGRWQTERVPYMREIMDCCNDPLVEIITIMKASRMAITEGLINNRIGYNVDIAPRPMLYVQQNLNEARKYSDLMLKYLIEDTPAVAKKAFTGTKETNTKLVKTFNGCSLVLAGANVSSGFRMIEVHDVYCDDVDGKDWGAGEEGGKIELAMGRVDNAPEGYGKIIIASSPTLKSTSRIERWFKKSDKRYFNVPCPHCDHGQVLKFGGKDFDYGLKWYPGEPDTTYYLCEHCHKEIMEWHKPDMMNQGIWNGTAEFTGNAGFHISRLISLFIPWKKMTERFLAAGTEPYKLQVFVNTWLGETFEKKSKSLKSEGLYGRREMYGPAVPNEASIITLGADVQDNRIECEIVAWAADEESYNMYYHVLPGDTTQKEVWDDFDRLLLKPLYNINGNKLYILGAAIDYGYKPKQVGAFVRPRQSRLVAPGVEQRIIAIRGANQPGKPIMADKPFSDKNVGKMSYYWVGTDTAKDTLFSYMALKEFGPGFMHFPVGDEELGYIGRDERYFKQLTSEKVFIEKDKWGNRVRRYDLKDGRRNEALDCRVYAYAVLQHLINNCGLDLDKYTAEVLRMIETGKLSPTKESVKQSNGRRVGSPGVDRSKYGG